MGGRLRHLPGGVDEYLRLRQHEMDAPAPAPAKTSAPTTPRLEGAELRAAQKEISALERRIQKLTQQIDAAKHALVEHDQSDYTGLGEKKTKIGALEAEVEESELRWFELTEQVC